MIWIKSALLEFLKKYRSKYEFEIRGKGGNFVEVNRIANVPAFFLN